MEPRCPDGIVGPGLFGGLPLCDGRPVAIWDGRIDAGL
jgi:hypothetical protein